MGPEASAREVAAVVFSNHPPRRLAKVLGRSVGGGRVPQPIVPALGSETRQRAQLCECEITSVYRLELPSVLDIVGETFDMPYASGSSYNSANVT